MADGVKISALAQFTGKQMSDIFPFVGGDPYGNYVWTVQRFLNLGMTGISGGTATDLNAWPTIDEAAGQLWNVVGSDNLFTPYQLQLSTAAQSLPNIVHPLDFNAGNNPKVFQLLGVKSNKLVLTGTAGAGYVEFVGQSGAPSTPSSALRAYADSADRFSWISTDGFSRTFSGSPSDNRVYTLPDASGTVALTATTVPSTAGTAGQVLVNGGTIAVAGTAITLSLAAGLTSINSVTSTAGQNLVLALGTGGTALTLTSSTLAAAFAGAVSITGHATIEGVTSTGATGTGNIVFSITPTLTGSPVIGGTTFSSSAATALNSVTSTAGQNLILAVGTGGTALTITSSTLASTFAGALSVTGHTTFEGVTSTGATGTGNLVYSITPTLTGSPVVGGATFSSNAATSLNSVTSVAGQNLLLAVGTGGTALTITTSTLAAAFAGALSVTGHTTFEGVTSTGATGTGKLVYDTSPTLATPTIGVATATSINGLTITASTGVLTITNAKTLAATNTLTFSGTDSTTMTFPTTSATIARTDAANTFTGHQTIEGVTSTGATGTGNLVFSITPTLTGSPVVGGSTFTSSAVTSLNSITSVAGQNLVLAVGTGGTALTVTTSTLAATFAGALSVTGHTTFEGVTSTGATGTGNFVYSITPTLTGSPVVGGITFSSNAATSFNTITSQAATALALNANGNVTIKTTDGTTLAATFSGTGTTLAGLLTTVASATSSAGVRIPHGAAPTSPTNGDTWTTTAGFYARINGATVGPFAAAVASADPSASVGLTTVTGSASTFMRSDAAPALSQTIVPTWTGLHTFSATPVVLSGSQSAAAWGTNGQMLKISAATLTDTSSSGTITHSAANAIGATTLAASSATTVTHVSQIYIAKPVQGTNVTATSLWSVFGAGSITAFSGSNTAGSASLGINDSEHTAIQGVYSGTASSSARYGGYFNADFLGTTDGLARYKAVSAWSTSGSTSTGNLTSLDGGMVGCDANIQHQGTGTISTLFGVRAKLWMTQNTISPATEVAMFYAANPDTSGGNASTTYTRFSGFLYEGTGQTAMTATAADMYGFRAKTFDGLGGASHNWAFYADTNNSWFGGNLFVSTATSVPGAGSLPSIADYASQLIVQGGTTLSAGAAGTITLTNTSQTMTTGDVIGNIDFYNNDATSGAKGVRARIQGVITTSNGRAAGLAFYTGIANLTEKGRVDDSGFWMLGSSTNHSSEILQVTGAAYVSGATLVGTNLTIGTGFANSPTITFGADTSKSTIGWDNSNTRTLYTTAGYHAFSGDIVAVNNFRMGYIGGSSYTAEVNGGFRASTGGGSTTGAFTVDQNGTSSASRMFMRDSGGTINLIVDGAATESTSTTTGQFTISGGVGMLKNLNVGGSGTFGAPVGLKNYVVSGLPSASTSGAGAVAYVTDSTATAITGLGLAVVGSGSNKVVVVSDGTNWIVQ